MSKIGNHVVEAEESALYMTRKHFLEVYSDGAIYIWNRVNGADDSLEDEKERQREALKEQERIRQDSLFTEHKELRKGFKYYTHNK